MTDVLNFESKNICFSVPKSDKNYEIAYPFISVLKILKCVKAFEDPNMDEIILRLELKVQEALQ
jgi:hypothetical protein